MQWRSARSFLGESLGNLWRWSICEWFSGEFLLFSARCCLVYVHSFIFIFVLYYDDHDVLITNSCDCWVSISGSGVDTSFFAEPKKSERHPQTLEPAVGLQSKVN